MSQLHQGLYRYQVNKMTDENHHTHRSQLYTNQSEGKLVYAPSVKGVCDPTWLIVECNPDLVSYYAWFLRKRGIKLDVLMWGSHISVIRGKEDYDQIPSDQWGLWDGQTIAFRYGDLVTNGNHWWLEVSSQELDDLREWYGLSPHPSSGYHVTIGKISGIS